MKVIKIILIFLGVELLSPSVMACAPGVQSCIPPNSPISPLYRGNSSSNSGSAAPSSVPDAPYEAAPAKWADRWGAIATDGRGTAGIVANLSSKREAEHSAISECKNRGGGVCAVQLSYHNQCAAVVAGRTAASNTHAETKEEAITMGMRSCEKRDGQGKCWVYYSGCSYPERVQ